jgi:hypothetical protein
MDGYNLVKPEENQIYYGRYHIINEFGKETHPNEINFRCNCTDPGIIEDKQYNPLKRFFLVCTKCFWNFNKFSMSYTGSNKKSERMIMDYPSFIFDFLINIIN